MPSLFIDSTRGSKYQIDEDSTETEESPLVLSSPEEEVVPRKTLDPFI